MQRPRQSALTRARRGLDRTQGLPLHRAAVARNGPRAGAVRGFLGGYGLSVVLALFFIGSWLIQSVAGWVEFVAEQAAHGETAALFGPEGYVYPWLKSTFENWQSEFLQLFTFVVLTTFLIHRHSHESRDSNEKMAKHIDATLARVEAIEEKLDELQPKRKRS